MYKRLELHNHTTESDSSITPKELIDIMIQDKVDAFAITDHNTISGQAKIEKLLAQSTSPIQCINGMEYTTYYGHILCFNLREYISWENIDRQHPEKLFRALRSKGALIGVAHPFSYGHPFARGCGWDMEIRDYSTFDFIEIFNNPEPLYDVNQPALQWWEELTLQNHPLAITCGMDLHGQNSMSLQYAVYIQGKKEGNISKELEQAIRTQKTHISKGPLITVTVTQTKLNFQIIETGKTGYTKNNHTPYILTLRTKKGILQKSLSRQNTYTLPREELQGETIIIPKLYTESTDISNLLSVAPVIYL